MTSSIGLSDTNVPCMDQVTGGERLLGTARDCFSFVTKFFEVINVSATHIYHSALELSPRSSIVRKLHYHRRPTPLPKIMVGIPNSWDSSIAISITSSSSEPSVTSVTWSPCGQFVAARTEEAVEIRDALTFELLSTLQLTEPTARLMGTIAYSPDGRSLCVSSTAIVIWDIQTGGVAKGIQCDETYNFSPVWSLDGRIISTVSRNRGNNTWTVRGYNVASGTTLLSTTFQSQCQPHLWAHDESFRVMTAAGDSGVYTIDIYKVGPTLTKIESFFICWLGEHGSWIESFSPTTHRILTISNCWWGDRFRILDVRNSRNLLESEGFFFSHTFSFDGDLFAAFRCEHVHIWKYDGSHYTPWKQLLFQTSTNDDPLLQFSPISSSILGYSSDILRLWCLDDPPVYSAACKKLQFISRSATYVVTAYRRGHTVTITDVLSRIPPQSIDTGVEPYIKGLALTGNVLLVLGSGVIRAWRLTEEGVVDGVLAEGRAGHGGSIWTIPIQESSLISPRLLVQGQHGIIKSHGIPSRVYNTRTGELSPKLPDFSSFSYFYDDFVYNDSSMDIPGFLPFLLEEEWVKGPGRKLQLWLPAEWRETTGASAKWSPNLAMLTLSPRQGESITIKLY